MSNPQYVVQVTIEFPEQYNIPANAERKAKWLNEVIAEMLPNSEVIIHTRVVEVPRMSDDTPTRR